jgi:hypothetical protein
MANDPTDADGPESWQGFAHPQDIASAKHLSPQQKIGLLGRWEQDLRQHMTASREGMPVPEENQTPEILRAVRKLIRELER